MKKLFIIAIICICSTINAQWDSSENNVTTGSVLGRSFIARNPNNTSANISLSWLNDIPRLRIGGIGEGVTNGFEIQGSGDKVLFKVSNSGVINSTGAIIDGNLTVDNEDGEHSNIRIGHGTNDRIIADDSDAENYGGGYFFRVTSNPSLNKASNYIDVMLLDDLGNVGIGLKPTSEKLEIFDSATTPAVIALKSLRNDATHVDVGVLKAKQGDTEIARIGMPRAGGTYSGYLTFWTKPSNDASLQESMRVDQDGNVGIGTTDTKDYKLAVAGTTGIIAEKVTVKTYDNGNGWPDYVFKADYDLPTLKEVENHITEKGHLQNIPSAEEVKENGVELGNMSKNLLQKVEELTLYTIQQEKKLEKQNQILENQSNEMNELKKLVKQLIDSKK